MAYLPLPMRRDILIYPEPVLRKQARPAEDLSDPLRTLADDMLETMYEAPGIGLAAPQVGVSTRLIVMDCEKGEGTPPHPMIMFNPEVVAASDVLSTYEEGCLSFPDAYADVARPAEVTVAWMDETGGARQQDFSGLWATCVQHEIDHLNGVLFIDHLKPLRRQIITRKMKKLKRDLTR